MFSKVMLFIGLFLIALVSCDQGQNIRQNVQERLSEGVNGCTGAWANLQEQNPGTPCAQLQGVNACKNNNFCCYRSNGRDGYCTDAVVNCLAITNSNDCNRSTYCNWTLLNGGTCTRVCPGPYNTVCAMTSPPTPFMG